MMMAREGTLQRDPEEVVNKPSAKSKYVCRQGAQT